ncbi:MAG: CotH kinase family protein [Cyclobacteriaceae bacterium]|nr:CotH kinase family protein [Cyclobacteriaceae bacterium]
MTTVQTIAQTSIDHWETVVYDSMVWRYHRGVADPGASWFQPTFNDTGWLQGRGSIGYGDNDDRTIIDPTLSVFLRKKFTITNKEKIVQAILHVDYDDGFIAYLNGVEIARAMMGNQALVPSNQPSTGLHEALLYQGIPPEGWNLDATLVNNLLVNGENTLAIQVHNENITSSDLTSAVFFSVGISDNSRTYLPVPPWFQEPTAFTSSNLPIVVINTGGQIIRPDPRIVVDMGIIYNGEGQRNQLTDPPNEYNGKIAIEIRGESSQLYPKKSFRIETQTETGENLNVPLLGMPRENDWVLYAPYPDKSMLRDVLSYDLGRAMGRYAPRGRYVELVLNGSYEGVYVLLEKIKIDNNRVDIATLRPEDISGRELTGGYLLRLDKTDANDYPAWTATPFPIPVNERNFSFQFYDPKGGDMQPQQRNYIQNYMVEFQSSLSMLRFQDPFIGYKAYLDIPAAIDFMLVNEISKNVDAYIFSTYFYKEKDKADGTRGKLVMGPLWDFNFTFGNVDYHLNSQVAPGWMYNDDYRIWWYRRLMSDPYFAALFTCRWEELRSTWLTNQYVMNKVDSIVNHLSEAQVRNYQRWPILGVYVWPNQYVAPTYALEIAWVKRWIEDRLFWMDTNKPGDCQLITSVEVPVLESQLAVYPNPFNEQVTITLPDSRQPWQISITNSLGQLVYKITINSLEFNWDGHTDEGHDVPPGIYIITLTQADGGVRQQAKLIRQ